MKEVNEKIQKRFADMCKTGKLFTVALTGQQVWDLYLKGFPPEQDPIFRDPNSTTHNCNLCNNFIRRYGNVVAIVDNKVVTMFDVVVDDEYNNSLAAMSTAIKASPVKDVFFETFDELNSLPYESCIKTNKVFRLGVAQNHKRYTKEEAELYGVVQPNEIRTFPHFHLDLPKDYVDTSGKSIESIRSDYRSDKEVFKRGMDEISLDTLVLVKDLINQGSLLDGTTHLHKIEKFITLKKEYDNLAAADKDNWCWLNSFGLSIAKLRNELIGTLCVELTEGEDLNKACENWNKRVDPANYMKAIAPITKKQIEEAAKFVKENDYEGSFKRRLATMDDIKVSEILHANVGDGKLKNASIFDGVKATSTRHKRSEFDKLEEVSIEKFMNDILPSCTSVEAFLANKHEGNMVTMTTADDKNSKPIFKWPNNYSWTYNGNLAGKSQIKEAVKSQGGIVDGVLRFSVSWSGPHIKDNSDLDAHAQEPGGSHIYYAAGFRKDSGNKRTSMGGQLDIDITNPASQRNHMDVVENIAWNDLSKMKNGRIQMWVNQYAARNSQGFIAEVEFDGQIYTYRYDRPLSQGTNIHVAEVTLKDGEFSIKHLLPCTEGEGVNKEIYGLDSNCFHKVNLVCLSPNHWDGNTVGNKHYFFMLENAQCPIAIRSLHNENLIPELLTHRKVMEVLGAKNMIEPGGKQLSGLGFNSTVKDELVLKLGGSFKRMIKVKFA